MKNAFGSIVVPGVTFSSPAIFRTKAAEIPGNVEKLSLSQVSVCLSGEISSREAGTLVIDSHTAYGKISLEVRAVVQKSESERGFFTVFEIVEMDRKQEERVIHLYARSLWSTVVSKVPQRNFPLVPKNLVGVFEKDKVLSTLKDIFPEGNEGYFVHHDISYALEVVLQNVTDNQWIFRSRNEKFGRAGDNVDKSPGYIFWASGFRQHLFLSQVLSLHAKKLILADPFLLLSSSIREETRTAVDPGEMWVEIPLPFPRGAFLRREIIDISPSGFAFKCPPDEAYFLPGTPIGSLKIISKTREPFVSAGQIRHVTPVAKDIDEPYLKVGVQLQISNKAFAKGHVQPNVVVMRNLQKGQSAQAEEKSGILSTFKNALRSGLNVRDDRGYSDPTLAENVIKFRHLNEMNQEIVGLLNKTWNTNDRRRASVVLLPPPYGKRKESMALIAYYLLEKFRRHFHNAVIVRYDSINHVGESYKDPRCREPFKECLHMTLSQGTADIISMLDYIENNDYFLVRDVTIISFSLAALLARKAILKDERRRVHLWVAPMGVTNMADLLERVSGGIDYFDLYKHGTEIGDVTILGLTVKGDRFCKDALEAGYAGLDEAVRDVSEISIPIVWLYGMYDAWINPENVTKLLDAKKMGLKKIKVLPTGHLPLNGEEALSVFKEVFIEMWSQIGTTPEKDFEPNYMELMEKQESEWRQQPKGFSLNKRKYWASYLLGENESDMGYDILQYCEEYVSFVEEQVKLLDIGPGQRVVDMGCGTGNVILNFLENYSGETEDFPSITLVDLVDEALQRAREKYLPLLKERGIEESRFEFVRSDLDIHPSLPLKKFVLGEYSSIDELKGQIPGISNYTIDLWKKNYSPRLHRILRGKVIGEADELHLDKSFPKEEKKIILEFNRAARFIRHILGPLCPIVMWSETNRGQTGKMEFLGVDLHDVVFRLPFEDNFFDRLISSLVLSYMKNPEDTMAEFFRCLKPGGVAVISSMKPDTDMSRIYTRMIQRLKSGEIPIPDELREKYLNATRNFANAAAQLIQMVDERKFRFFHPDELCDLAKDVGFCKFEVIESYGDPPQAFIIKTVKPVQ